MSLDLRSVADAFKKFNDHQKIPVFACDYMVIASKSTVAALNEFVAFKQNIIQHNIEVLCIEDIQEITRQLTERHKALMLFMHFLHSWKGKPKYLLLVGDCKSLPGYPVRAFNNNVNSDHRYTVLNDDDYRPWCYVGRISSENPDEIRNICRHLIRYNHLPTESGWHKRVIMTGWTPGSPHRYYFDASGHRETKPYENYPDFGDLDEKEARGLNDTAPVTGIGIPASWHYTNETNGYEVVRSYEWKECSIYLNNGRPSLASQHTDCVTHKRIYDPDPLLEIDYWGVRNSSKSTLIHAINSGVVIVKYIGHSDWSHWTNIGHLHCQDSSHWDMCEPLETSLGGTVNERCLTRWDVKGKIDCRRNPPLILSLSCLAGMIEDPKPDTLDHEEETFAESWQRTCNAIGVYAASITSPTYYNARIGRYIFRALTQGFMGSGPIKTVGQALSEANCALLRSHIGENGKDKIGNDFEPHNVQLVKDAIRIYRYFGDPETKLRY